MALVLPTTVPACKIRLCKESDLQGLEQMYLAQEGETVPFHYFGHFQSSIRSGNFVVAEAEGKVIGGGGVRFEEGSLASNFFFGIVERQMQKQGFGTALLFSRFNLVPVFEAGIAVSLQATEWSKPFLSKYGCIWPGHRFDEHGICLFEGIFRLSRDEVEQVDKLLERCGVEIECTEHSFPWSRETYPMSALDNEEMLQPLLQHSLGFNILPLSDRDNRFAKARIHRFLLERTKVRQFFPPAAIWFIVALIGQLIEAPIMFWVALLGFLWTVLIAITTWMPLTREIHGWRMFLKSGERRELSVSALRIWEFEDRPKRIRSYAFELSSNKVLLVRGRGFMSRRQFPCLRFNVVLLCDQDSRQRRLIVYPESAKSQCELFVSAALVPDRIFPQHINLYEGSLESVVFRLGRVPVLQAQKESVETASKAQEPQSP